MASKKNSSDDNLENKKNKKKYDDKFECYNYDDNKMYTMYLKNSEIDKVKIDKVKDYYDLFVSMLKVEHENLRTHEHLWIMGIDATGYAACVYVVTIGYPNFFSVAPTRLFKMALQQNSIKIIIAQSRPDAKVLDVTPTDLDLSNAVYHKAEILGLELVDHIIISNVSIDRKKPFYCSHLENGVMCFVQTDMTYKSYKDIEPEIEKARNEFGADQKAEGLIEGKVEMVKKLLIKNIDINIISESSGFTIKEIKKINTDRCTE